MSVSEQKQTGAASVFFTAFSTVAAGFTLTMHLFGSLVCWAGLGTVVQGNILGFAFQLSTALFFFVVGLSRALKRVPVFSTTVYRLVHFLVSAAWLYVCYFVIWQPLSVALGEQKVDNLASGAINFAHIILAFVVFVGAYFAVIGIRAAVFARRAKRERDRAAYDSMLEKRKKN